MVVKGGRVPVLLENLFLLLVLLLLMGHVQSLVGLLAEVLLPGR